jgi:multimeric flavodoxin WrbA
MKVTAFVGSARKKHTYIATKQFIENLQSFGDIPYEIIVLNDYNIEACKGCKLCLDKGEELCQLKDDRNKLLEKMNEFVAFFIEVDGVNIFYGRDHACTSSLSEVEKYNTYI